MITSKYGAIKIYDEPPVVTSRPLSFRMTAKNNRKVRVKTTFNNEMLMFSNEDLDRITKTTPKTTTEDYANTIDLYLSTGLQRVGSPIKDLDKINYSQRIYPPQIYSYKSYVRERPTFSFKWRTTLANRQQSRHPDNFTILNVFNRSMWPLDVDPKWASGDFGDDADGLAGQVGFSRGDSANRLANTSSFGILWNHYSQLAHQLEVMNNTNTDRLPNTFLRPAPLYARRHTLVASSSAVGPKDRDWE